MSNEKRRAELLAMDELSLVEIAVGMGIYEPGMSLDEIIDAIIEAEPTLPGFEEPDANP